MAKKKQKVARPRRSLLVIALVVVLSGAGTLAHYAVHQHAVSADKARFVQANKDVQTVAQQIVAAVGQPQDRKDGGKCSYVHQEFGKGPLSCEVYSYLAYGVSSPDDVNAIVQKTEAVMALHGKPWKFQAITEKPYQFVGVGPSSDTFVTLRNLFDTESKSSAYVSSVTKLKCGLSYVYQNALTSLSGYPQFKISSPQLLLIDTDCSSEAKSAYFAVQS